MIESLRQDHWKATRNLQMHWEAQEDQFCTVHYSQGLRIPLAQSRPDHHHIHRKAHYLGRARLRKAH